MPGITRSSIALAKLHWLLAIFTYYRPQTKFAKIMFFTPVFQSFCSQDGKYLDRYPPSPPDQRQVSPPPLAGTPLAGTPLQRSACWEIRATSGRYSSYSNAILVIEEM